MQKQLKKAIIRPFILFLKKARVLGALAVKMTAWTGKSKYPLHPKHLIHIEEPWYLSHINKKDVVLDVGCGNGQHTLKSACFAKEIIGIDYNSQSLVLAAKFAKEENIKNVKFIKGNIERRLPFKSVFFDKVLFLDVLEHLNNRENAMEEIFRVLKPHGLLFLSIPNCNTSWKKLQASVGVNSFTDPDHKIEYSLAEAIKVCADYGFKVLSNNPIVFDTPIAPFFDIIGGVSLTLYSALAKWKKDQAQKNPHESIGFRIIAQKR